MVRKAGLEPARPNEHSALNATCLPNSTTSADGVSLLLRPSGSCRRNRRRSSLGCLRRSLRTRRNLGGRRFRQAALGLRLPFRPCDRAFAQYTDNYAKQHESRCQSGRRLGQKRRRCAAAHELGGPSERSGQSFAFSRLEQNRQHQEETDNHKKYFQKYHVGTPLLQVRRLSVVRQPLSLWPQRSLP